MESSPRPKSLVMLLLGLAALLIVGCGGGESNAKPARASSPSPPTSSSAQVARGRLSKKELVAQADAICKRVNTEILVPKSQSPSRQESEQTVGHNLAVERTALGSLSGLHPAKSVEHRWRRILSDRRMLAAELVEYLSDLRRNDQRAIQALGLSKTLAHSTLKGDATRFGLKDCAVVS
jgi:hypothetical protein